MSIKIPIPFQNIVCESQGTAAFDYLTRTIKQANVQSSVSMYIVQEIAQKSQRKYKRANISM